MCRLTTPQVSCLIGRAHGWRHGSGRFNKHPLEDTCLRFLTIKSFFLVIYPGLGRVLGILIRVLAKVGNLRTRRRRVRCKSLQMRGGGTRLSVAASATRRRSSTSDAPSVQRPASCASPAFCAPPSPLRLDLFSDAAQNPDVFQKVNAFVAQQAAQLEGHLATKVCSPVALRRRL